MGYKIEINENKVFTAASTYKVGLNMVTYEKIRKGSLDKYFQYNKVVHKMSNYGGAVSDIGIVFTDNPYVIVVYAEGVSAQLKKYLKYQEWYIMNNWKSN